MRCDAKAERSTPLTAGKAAFCKPLKRHNDAELPAATASQRTDCNARCNRFDYRLQNTSDVLFGGNDEKRRRAIGVVRLVARTPMIIVRVDHWVKGTDARACAALPLVAVQYTPTGALPAGTPLV